MITEQIVVGIYLRYLPEDLGAQVRDLAPNLNRHIRRGNKPRAGKRPLFSLQGRKVGAAQAPARTHSAPSPASYPV